MTEKFSLGVVAMSSHIEITDKCQKEDSFQINNSDNSPTKTFYEDGDIEADAERKQNKFSNILKRYSRYDLLSIRNGQLSIHYPHCTLRPELQALSIWTCRLRCELQYLGLWKIPNTGNSYGNCGCNGSCQSYSCGDNGGQVFASSSSPAGSIGGSQKYVNSQQVHQSQQTANSSPTLGSKRTVRSRERSLNYQRCINTELICGTSPASNGDQLMQYNFNHHTKASFIDHRSISSSHLMPAFAKRKMGHTNPMHNQVEVGSNFNNNSDGVSNNDYNENDTALKSRRESMKNLNNQNDLHLYKISGYSRPDKNCQYADGTGWMMNIVKKINTDYSSLNSKSSNSLSGCNKKLVYERRIGSGRLVPRDVNWEMRGSKKLIEKQTNSAPSSTTSSNIEKEKDIITSTDVDKLNNRNSTSIRFLDGQERRPYDRHVMNLDDAGSSAGSSNKRYTATALGNEGNNFESNYHQQQNFTGQRSMSFRRREYVDHRDYHRDFREFRESKELREHKEHTESKGTEHYYHNKDEPEWFSEGPTSQHDTIELRGFEECDESNPQMSIHKYEKIERRLSESSLLSHNSSTNINSSTKENVDISGEIESNSSNNAATNNLNRENDNDNNVAKEKILKDNNTFKESSENIEALTETNNLKSEEFNDEKNWRSSATELFFDNFLNIESLENSFIGNVNDQTMSNNDLSVGGTSRFSRWFFKNSNNQNNNDEHNNNPPTKDDPQRLSKDPNESEFSSFLTFLKCNNIPTPELPKSLPSNVSALSVEELEARMRKMDAGEKKIENVEYDLIQVKKAQNNRTTFSQSVDINSQDVEAFRKLLDQLGKPPADISMNIILPNISENSLPLTNAVSEMYPDVNAIPPSGAIPQSAMSKQEYVMKIMQQQHMQHHQKPQQHLLHHHQDPVKIMVPHVNNQRTTPMSPNRQSSDILSLLPVVPHHHHLMPMLLGQSQKRLDMQHLIQFIREELSRSFLEKELKNPNIPPYIKDIILAVLKETSRLNPPSESRSNLLPSETTAPVKESTTASGNLMQSLARGEVSLNHLEHELNKLNNIGNVSESTSSTGTLKERSGCGTPLNIVPITTSAGVIMPLPPSQVLSAQQQQQNLIIAKQNVATLLSDQQEAILSIKRSHHSDDQSVHISTHRDLQMHTQVMQNAMFKKKTEVEQNEQRRRQEMHKQHELESLNPQHQQQSNTTMTQQVHQQSSRRVNSPTPLAFTPTSVLRKMTAEKDTTSQTTTVSSSSLQQIQQHTQQTNIKLKQLDQIHSHHQHPNQPRMILGGGGFQYVHKQQHNILPAANGSPQISPQQKAQIRNQPAVPLKWPLISNSSTDSNHSLLNNMTNKPMGRPILKGPGPIVPLSTHNPQCQNQSSLNQNSQSILQINQMLNHPSIQQQQPRQIVGQQFSSHMLQHQIPSSKQCNMQHQQLFQQRSVVMQRHQIQQNDLGNHACLQPSTHHPVNNDSNSVPNLNYQRDGGLSPTSNQLAQWFSPELLAQASAGKLPLLNMNQALSLEEFERSIQHSSAAVPN